MESGTIYGVRPFFELDFKSFGCTGSCASSACFLQNFITSSGNIAFECVQYVAAFLHLQHWFEIFTTVSDVSTSSTWSHDKSIIFHFTISIKCLLSVSTLAFAIENKQYARFFIPTSKLKIIIFLFYKGYRVINIVFLYSLLNKYFMYFNIY